MPYEVGPTAPHAVAIALNKVELGDEGDGALAHESLLKLLPLPVVERAEDDEAEAIGVGHVALRDAGGGQEASGLFASVEQPADDGQHADEVRRLVVQLDEADVAGADLAQVTTRFVLRHHPHVAATVDEDDGSAVEVGAHLGRLEEGVQRRGEREVPALTDHEDEVGLGHRTAQIHRLDGAGNAEARFGKDLKEGLRRPRVGVSRHGADLPRNDPTAGRLQRRTEAPGDGECLPGLGVIKDCDGECACHSVWVSVGQLALMLRTTSRPNDLLANARLRGRKVPSSISRMTTCVKRRNIFCS